nr:2-isopropylmalate synthase [Gammaproteobacteria bacterium]
EVIGKGNGTLTAFINAMENHTGKKLRILNYAEHALSAGTNAKAMAYVQVDIDGHIYAGVSSSNDTVQAMLYASLSAINKAIGTDKKDS